MAAIPFAQFVSEMLDLYRPPLRRQSTYLKLRTVLGEFARLGLESTAEITPAAIARWISSPAASGRRAISNRSYLSAMRAAVTIAVKMRWLEVSPWSIRTDWIDWAQDDEPSKPRHLSIEDVGRLLDQADREADRGAWREARLQALVYIYVFTGLRKSEALGLRCQDLDLAARTLAVCSHRRRRLKTRASRRLIPLHPELVGVLTRWSSRCGSLWLIPTVRGAGPWLNGATGAKPLDQVQALATRAGLAHATIQSLRRSLATHGRRWGWGQLEVQELLGHGSAATQDWYLEDDLADQRAAIDRIRYRRWPPPERAA